MALCFPPPVPKEVAMMAGYEILPLAIMIIALALAAMGFYKGDKQARIRHPVRAVWQPNPSRRGEATQKRHPLPALLYPRLELPNPFRAKRPLAGIPTYTCCLWGIASPLDSPPSPCYNGRTGRRGGLEARFGVQRRRVTRVL